MASAQPEPSMDEILASIRRIISEEDGGEPEAPQRTPLAPLNLEESNAVDPEQVDAAGSPAGPDDLGVDDLEPASELPSEPQEDPTPDVTAEPVAAEAAAPPASPSPAAAPVSSQTPEPGVAVPAAQNPTVHNIGPDQANDIFGIALKGNTPVPATPAKPSPMPSGEPVVEAPVPTPGSLVNREAAASASEAFATLEESIRLSTKGGRSLEDLVQEMLTPLLQAWLNENLPRIVEEKVDEEVRRIARRR